MSVLLRLLVGGALAWCVALAVLAAETSLAADLATVVIVLLAGWRLSYGLAGLLMLTPAGVLLAPAPARVAELLAWAFVATSLLRVRRDGPTSKVGPYDERGVRLQPDVRTSAILFGACVIASWCGLMVAGAAGVDPGAIPRLLAHAIRMDHLLFGSAEPETSAMLQILAGLALFGAAMKVAREDGDATRITAWAVVASGVCLAIATEADVLRQWAREDYGGWFLWRYVRGERFSLHLADLNAAGSLYVLSGLAAVALATADRARRWIWAAAAAVMLPALWLTGSRSAALGAIVIGASVIPLARRRWRVGATHAAAAIAVLVIATAGASIVTADQSQEHGSATSALRLRSQFLVTSARMFASAPVFGVGVGQYHQRSAEFMPASLRTVYPFENAHNYFAQQFAELGIVGGLLFVSLVVAGIRAGWKGLSPRAEKSTAQLALVAGCVGYLLTCVTGHPLLVSEAALPFWGAFGVMTPAFSSVALDFSRKVAAAVVILLLLGGVALQARHYARVSTPPAEHGFHGEETSPDGVRFNWMTRHGVFYIGTQPGFVVIPIHIPDLPRARPRPFVVDVDVGGRRMGSYELEPGTWNEIRIGVRDDARTPFRRVDLRVNQHWTRRHDLGLRDDDVEPRSVKVGDVRWEPAGAR